MADYSDPLKPGCRPKLGLLTDNALVGIAETFEFFDLNFLILIPKNG